MPNSPTASHSFQYPAAAAVPDQPPKQQPQPQQPQQPQQQPQQLSPQQQQQLLQHRQLQEQLQRLNPLQYSAISQAASAMLYRQMQPPVPAVVTTSAVPMMPAYYNPFWQQQQYHLLQQPQPHIVAQPQQHAQEPVTTVPTAWLMEILLKKEQQTRELDQLKEQLAAAKSAAAAAIVHSAPASPPSVTTTGGSSPKRSRKPMAEPLAVPAASSSTSATPAAAAAAAAMQPPTPTVLAAGAALKAIRSSQPPAPAAPRTSPVPVPAEEEEARKSPVGGKRTCEEADAGAEANAEAAMECDKKDGLPVDATATVDDASKQKRGSNDSLATDDTHNFNGSGSSEGDAEEAASAAATDMPQYAGKPERMAREVDRRLSSREAERLLREYVEQLTKKLMAMKERPFRLSLCQRPDDRFLHEIELPVLYRLPAFLEYQGKEFPRQLLVSDMLFEDAAGRAVLDLKRLRGRVIVRIEKSGQRKRSRMYAYRPPPTVQPFDLEGNDDVAENGSAVEEAAKAVEEEEKVAEEKAVEAVDVSTAEDVDDLSRSLERQSSLSDSSSQKSDTQR